LLVLGSLKNIAVEVGQPNIGGDGRITGSHEGPADLLSRASSYTGDDVPEILNLQVRGVIVTHGLVHELEDNTPQDETILNDLRDS
jgi:hypothetical protein